MSECEERVSGYPLRVANGFPCRRPAKYVMAGRNFGAKNVCGIHRNQLLREGWLEYPSALDAPQHAPGAAGEQEETER